MTEDSARHLVVGRLRKPHGLKGECAVFPLTDDAATVFGVGRSVWLKDLNGEIVQGPLVISRCRPFHRQWLVTFRGWDDRGAVEKWHDLLLTAPEETLKPPAEGEVYLHELAGFAVVTRTGDALGVVTAVDELPVGLILEVQGRKREFLLPFRKEFVVEVDRSGKRLVVEIPDGLIDG